jgi:class 3 adenylate cyclase/TolB-like protein
MDSSDIRQLSAITFIDIANFSELMHNDEKEALRILELQKDIIFPIINNYNGKILKEMGDGLLISFNSAIQAAKCSIEIQSKIEYVDKLNYRIGIHIGDVIIIKGDIIGDGVNIASRIQESAGIGEICISQTVYEALINHPSIQCTLLGGKQLKGIAEKVKLYKINSKTISNNDPQINTSSSIENKPSSIKFILLGLFISIGITISIIDFLKSPVNKNEKISVAVLPFGNTKQDEEFEFLSQQFVDELTPVLIKIPYISLKDFSQVRKIFDSIKPKQANIIDLSLVQKLGKQVNADYILYGNYAIINEHLRITCNIADVSNGIIINSYKESFNFYDLIKLLDSFPNTIKDLVENTNLKNKENLNNE